VKLVQQWNRQEFGPYGDKKAAQDAGGRNLQKKKSGLVEGIASTHEAYPELVGVLSARSGP